RTGERLLRLLPGGMGPLPGRPAGGGEAVRQPGTGHPAPGDRRDLRIGGEGEGRGVVRDAVRRLVGWSLVPMLVSAPVAGPLHAQGPTAPTVQPPTRPSAEPGSELTISVLTMGVGAEVWERFGHNAIVVEDRAQGTSLAYNYGMFSFTQENFVLRFVQGRMTYWMEGFDTERDLARYVRRKRSVWQQELDLTPAERVAMRDALAWNAREENRYYKYDYYLDNCS